MGGWRVGTGFFLFWVSRKQSRRSKERGKQDIETCPSVSKAPSSRQGTERKKAYPESSSQKKNDKDHKKKAPDYWEVLDDYKTGDGEN